MGTRSLTHIKGDIWEEGQTPDTLVTIYRQYDGYPTGQGADLVKILSGGVIVNGFSSDQPEKVFNGMGELAAIVVAALKGENPGGNIYLYEPGAKDVGEEYTYTIYTPSVRATGPVHIRCEDSYSGKVLFDGPVDDIVIRDDGEG